MSELYIVNIFSSYYILVWSYATNKLYIILANPQLINFIHLIPREETFFFVKGFSIPREETLDRILSNLLIILSNHLNDSDFDSYLGKSFPDALQFGFFVLL